MRVDTARCMSLARLANPLASTKFAQSLRHVAILGLAGMGAFATGIAVAADEVKPLTIAEVKHDGPVDFEKEILPVLRRSCLACHNAKDAESELVLETPQTIAKGGASGPTVIPKDGANSVLLKVAAHMEDPIMPPADNDRGAKNLTPEELGLLKLWIDQGATGEVTGSGGPVVWQPLPPGVNPIYAVAVSPLGEYAAAGRANQIFLYNVVTKQEIGRLTDPALLQQGVYKQPGVAHLDLVQSLAFSPDGERLASGGFRTTKIWKRPHNVKRGELAGLVGPVTSVVVSADGKQGVMGLADGKIQRFDLATGMPAGELVGHTGAVTGLAFTADGAQLISGSRDKTFRQWNLADGKELSQFATPSAIESLALVLEGKQVATGGADNMIRTWYFPGTAPPAEPLKEGELPMPPKPIKEFPGHGAAVNALIATGAGGIQLVSGSLDGTVRQWDANAGSAIRAMNHGAPLTSVAITADGKRIASTAENGTARLWNAENGQQIADIRADGSVKLQQQDKITRTIELTRRNTANAKADLDTAEKAKVAEIDNAKKAVEALAKSDADHKFKVTAAVKPVADKDVADKELAVIVPEVPKAEEAQKVAVTAATKAAETLTTVTADRDAKTKAAADAAVALKTVDEAKAAADKALADAQQKLKDAADDAAKAAAEALVKDATDKQAVAVKAAADAAAVAKAAEEAKVAAEKVVVDTTAAKKVADDAKVAADKVLADMQAKLKAAQDKAKAAEAPAKKAVDERDAAMRTFEAAQRAVERSKEAVKKATDELPAFVTEVTAREVAQKAAEDSMLVLQKQVADFNAELNIVTQRKLQADNVIRDAANRRLASEKAVADALVLLNAAQLEVDTALATGEKATADAGVLVVAAATKKAATDKLVLDADAALKTATDNKAAADKVLADAQQKQKDAADDAAKAAAEALVKDATDKLAVAVKALADADVAKKAADAAKIVDDKALVDEQAKATAVVAAANAASAAAAGKVAGAYNQIRAAETGLGGAAAASVRSAAGKAQVDKELAALTAKLAAATDEQVKAYLTAQVAAITARKEAIDKEVADAVALAQTTAAAKVETDKVLVATKTVLDAAAVALKKNADDTALMLKAATDAKTAADLAAATADAKSKAAVAAQAAADKLVTDTQARVTAAKDDGEKAASAVALMQAQESKVEADKAVADTAAALTAATAAKTAGEAALVAAQTKIKELTDAATKVVADATTAYNEALGKANQADAAAAGVMAYVAAAEAGRVAAEQAMIALQKPLRGCAFSPDGKQLAISSDDGTVLTFGGETGIADDILTGQAAPLGRVVFTADAALLSIGANNTGVIWNTRPEWSIERTIGNVDSTAQFADRVTALAFSTDGKILATGGGEPSRSGELKLWNIETGELIREIPDAHSDTIFGLEFSEDNKYLASCGADRFMKVFTVADGKFVKSFEGHTHHVLGVSWRADGRLLVTSGADNVIKVWSFDTGEQQRTIQGFNKEVTSVQFVGVTDNFVISAGDKQVGTRNTGGGNGPAFAGSADFMYCARCSRDGKTAVAGGQDSVVRVWNAATGVVIASFDPPVIPGQEKPAEATTQAAQ